MFRVQKITTETKHTEPAKMTNLPERPWAGVEADFCGPFPNGQYALVVTDQYSRYPEVEFVTTTSFEATRKKLKKIFSTHGVPETLQTDNGPPFNSHAFAEFAKESGFQHKRITPVHPKAQGQVEGFNKMINKTTTIATQDQIDPQEAIYDMLQAYRSTPHPATKMTPYQLLMNRAVRTRLAHFPTETHCKDEQVRERDRTYKQKCKEYHDKRNNTKAHTLGVGDAVVVKRENKRKAQTPYEPYIYIVTQVKGSQIRAKRVKDERIICRDASKFKLLRMGKTCLEDKDNPQTRHAHPSVPERVADQLEIAQVGTAEPLQSPAEETVPTDTAEPPQEPTEEDPEPPRVVVLPRRSERLKRSTFETQFKDFKQ